MSALGDEVPLRLLASAILFRACLRAFPRKPTPEDKMRLHQRVEEAAWQLPIGMLLLVEGREVDDGVPESLEWQSLVDRLVHETTDGRRP